ncbi:MAG: hypothetical protein EBU93_06740 [Chlamydiae bacterium]|nr:hypothetical protein [Chlamydiota bacterium]
MGLFNYIHMPLFIVSLIVGLFAVYITLPDQKLIYVYPTPENVDVLQYKDKTDTCFSFKQEKVSCPTDKKKITVMSAQS